MTETAAAKTDQPNRSASARVHGFREQVASRLRERSFWIVQAGVLAVTGLHIAVEIAGLHHYHDGPLGVLAHLPVFFYLVPVSYAGFRYGYEGSLLTGAWAALLAVPNLFVWHAAGLQWLGELLLIAVVVGVGALIAVPVEREKAERRTAEQASCRAEATSHRLALLNELAETLLRTARLDEAVGSVLRRLLEVMPLQAAALVRVTPECPEPSIELCHTRDPGAPCRLADELAGADPDRLDAWPHDPSARMPAFSWQVSDQQMALIVHIEDGQALSGDDRELLATVAAHIGVAMDNARMHRLDEERLQTYLRQVTDAQEEERRRIARDLHDVAAHELLLLCRDLDTLGDDPPPVPQLRDGVLQLRARAAGIVEYLRQFSRDLRPAMLDTLGLAPALRWLTAELADRTGIETSFRLSGAPRRLEPEVELALFRIAQEALRNVERHAGADRATVGVCYDGGAALIEVGDDGSGFDASGQIEEALPSGRLGLVGMRERAELAGCRLIIDSEPGRGTRVRVSTSVSAVRRACSTAQLQW